MTRPRTALAGLAAVLALLVLAVWQVPQWLDWTRYRSTIEVLASAALGQPVSIHGPVSLTLLAEPVLTASQVDVGGGGESNPSIHVEALRLRIALWPLLGGRVDARELVLGGADLRIPWPAEPGMFHPRPPEWLAGFEARIENGRLSIGQLVFSGIDASLATLETGALSASGMAHIGGQSWHFTVRLTAAGADGASGLDVTLDGQGQASGLGCNFTGQLARDGTLGGTITSRGSNLAVLLPAPAVPFRADGRLTVKSGLMTMSDLALEIGGSPGSGSVTLRVAPTQRLDISLAVSRLDLDAWLPTLVHARATIAGIDVPVGLDVSAEAAPLRGGMLEHVHATFDLTGGDLIVRQAGATLPGNGLLRLTGKIARDDPARLRFEGDARFDAPLLRTTLRWLDKAWPSALPSELLTELPEGLAQRATVSGDLVADPDEVRLQSITGTLDGAPVSGSLGLKHGQLPAVTANLLLDRLALDPWLPSQWPSIASLARPSQGLNLELRLNIRRATLRSVVIDGLAIDASVEAGSVLLSRAEGNLFGARFTAAGILSGGKLTGGKLSVATQDATRLADLLPASWRATPALWHGPAKLDVQVAGAPDALAADVQLGLADALIEASPTIDLESQTWNARLALRHPSARRLISALGLPQGEGLRGLPAWLGDGSLSLLAQIAGGPEHLEAKQFDVSAGAVRADGNLDVDLKDAEPAISGRIHADLLTLPTLSADSDVPLPLGILRGWRGDLKLDATKLATGMAPALDHVSAELSVADGALSVKDLAAQLGSGTLSGTASFNASANPPSLAIQVGLSSAVITGPWVDAPIDLTSGRADASLSATASGYSPSVILATLAGHFKLTAHDGTVSGFDLLRLKQAIEKTDPKSVQSAANDALSSGTTGFDRLEIAADIRHGDLVLDQGTLTGLAGEVHASGDLNLASDALDVRMTLLPAVPSPPEVALRLTGPIDKPNRAPELDNLARWMAVLVH